MKPAYTVTRVPTPLREPVHLVRVLIEWDARDGYPADTEFQSQLAGAMKDAQFSALRLMRDEATRNAMPKSARAYWGQAL